MFRAIIVDDEPLAIQLLEKYAQKSRKVEILKTFIDPIQALHFVQDHTVDLIFLDIQMSELSGLQLMKILKKPCAIILTTAYDKYALESYDYQVMDYLLKPISFERYMKAIQKIIPDTDGTEEVYSDYLFVKSGHDTVRVDYDDILYLQGMGDYVGIYLSNKKILTLDNLKYFEKKLPLDKFIRIHKSYLIAISKIELIQKNRVKIAQNYFPISDTYAAEFWKRIRK